MNNTKKEDFLKEISLEEFRNSGLLWLVNSILHVFGMAIVIDIENNRMYPARCKFRGFSEESNTKGYTNLAKYMKENSEDLLKDCEE